MRAALGLVPFFLVPKADGTIRLCNDLPHLNIVSDFDTHPLPQADDLIKRLDKSCFITTLLLILLKVIGRFH